MQNFDLPPLVLRLPPSEWRQSNGAWRSWDSGATSCIAFRQGFVAWATHNQRARCAFCCLRVGRSDRRTKTLDHFIPKGGTGLYACWTYEPLNLLLACHECNSKLKQAHVAIVGPTPSDYRCGEFTLFHPYLHRPASLHFDGGYTGLGKPRLVRARSNLGESTVQFFELRDPGLLHTWMAEYREDRRVARIERLSEPLRRLLRRACAEVN